MRRVDRRLYPRGNPEYLCDESDKTDSRHNLAVIYIYPIPRIHDFSATEDMCCGVCSLCCALSVIKFVAAHRVVLDSNAIKCLTQ